MTSIITSVQVPAGDYTHNDVFFGKYFKAVNVFGKQVLYVVFIVIYSSLETLNGNLTVHEYCKDKLNWTSTLYKNIFTASERGTLNNDPKGQSFICDITLLFKLISKVINDVAEPFLQEIRDLKNMRNTVCHEDVTMDETTLKKHLKELEVLCCKILDGMDSVTGADIAGYVKDLKDGLQALLVAKVQASDVESYLQEIKQFREHKHSKFIIEGRKELIDVYSKVKVLNPCSWLSDNKFNEFRVDNIFTTLVVVNNGSSISMHDILNVRMIKTRFVPRLIVVSGVMGAGKTSLNRYILHEWCNHSPSVTGLAAMDIVIGVELRSVCCDSLVQFLREQLLKSTSRLFHESDIIPLLQEMNVLFCIDGMDEAGPNGKKLVKEIVNKFSSSRIIVTTRPEFTLELMQMAEDHIVLEIEGFDDQGKMQFINNVFNAKYTDLQRRCSETTNFLNFMSTTCQRISHHLTLPLSLSLLVVVWCDDSVDVTSISTLTHLYQKIYDMCQRKLISRLEASGAGHAVSINLKINRWLAELGRVAWDMMCEDVLSISDEQSGNLMKLCENLNIDPIQTMSAFLNCDIKETVVGTVYSFSFSHTSSQEYLAALFISEEVAAGKSVSHIFEAIDSPRFHQLMMYVTGLLKKRNKLTNAIASQIKSLYVIDMEVKPNDYNTWWKLLKEAERDTSMAMVLGSIVNQTYVWIVSSLDPQEDTIAKLNLLRETGAAPSELIMDVHYTTMLSECDDLQEILKLVGQSQKCKVKLYLNKEFNLEGCKEISDSHVLPLLKSNSLVEFKGHVGKDLMLALVEATHVESLFIRVSTLDALRNLQVSVRKHRRWKVKFMPSRKWALRFLELFLDISTDISPDKIPRLYFRKTFVVKLANISDNNAVWAGNVMKNLNTTYTSIIFLNSTLTISGMKEFLHAVADNDIKSIRVLSENSTTVDQMQYLAKKYGTRIGWRSS